MPAGIGDVPATSFITLWCHALDAQSANPVLSDKKSVEITAGLSRMLAGSDQPLDRILVSGKLDRRLVVHIVIRAKKYDDYAREFLRRYPDGVIVNIGCGLDSRFERIDNGHVTFYDLDLPAIIALKKDYFRKTERYRFIASSVSDTGWMAAVRKHPGPFLFMAEGVFMYLEKGDVRSLVLALRETFPGSELVCEIVNAIWLSPLLKPVLEFKLQHEAHLGKEAMFRSGLRDGREMEGWHPGIRFLDEWSSFDSDEPQLGGLRLLRHIPWIRKTQWTVRYRLE